MSQPLLERNTSQGLRYSKRLEKKHNFQKLVGGFNPFEKYDRQIMSKWIISPGFRVKIKNS